MFSKLIKSRFMRVASAFLLVSFINYSILTPSMAAQARPVVLKAGTTIVLETVNNLSSKEVTQGSTVDFKVVYDIKAGNTVVIPSGTIAKGQVSNVKRAAAIGKPGEITVTLNAINAIDGTLVPISGASSSAVGKDKKALAIVCGIFTLIGLIIHGEEAVLPAGTQVQAVVMSNTSISAQQPELSKYEPNDEVEGLGGTALEQTIIRWDVQSRPQGADIYWRVVSKTPEVKSTNNKYLMTTPYEATKSLDIRGLSYQTAGDVRIILRCVKDGYLPQEKEFNTRTVIDQEEISAFFSLVKE